MPHPRIVEASGRAVEVSADTPLAVEVDGVEAPAARRVTVDVVPEAFCLLL